MDTIGLREAKPADAAAIGALHVASWRETYAGILPAEVLAELSVEARIAMWGQILSGRDAAGGAAVFVAEEDRDMVGFGACGRQRDKALADAGFGGEIGAIYVLRSHQNRGVGRSLMRAMFQALLDQGHAAASLWVMDENRPARIFYEAHGGELILEKREKQAGFTLVEVAYGWRDLSVLVR